MEESGQKLYDEGGFYHGFQIWLNTPAKYKFIDPTTSVYRESDMDTIVEKDFSLKVVLGELGEARSNIDTHSPAFYYHVKTKDNARLDIPTDPTHNVFIYQIGGRIELEGQRTLKPNQLALFQRGESLVNIYAECESEFLVLGGAPLNEPVYSYGPFVMTNETELMQALRDAQMGKMGVLIEEF